MARKSVETYIVEGTNWKCKVLFNKLRHLSPEDELIEVTTQCFEHIFGKYPHMDVIDIFELRDLNTGIDYFKNIEEETIPDPSFGLLTKIYKKEDIKNADNHYVVQTKFIFENASNIEAASLADQLEQEIKTKNPDFVASLKSLMKNTYVLKYGDLKNS